MTKRRREWETAFLSSLQTTGVVAWAAKAADVGRQTVYDHMKADPEFAKRCEEALGMAEDSLEDEVMRRALEGEQVPVYFKGKVVGQQTRKSDTLLMFALNSLRRRREREAPKSSSLRQFFGL
ncbi:MAG: hypothetical protein OXP66_03955 [Candidatus Tectomicrobia bacterium]|nr:hypothetical protein [Candidatus Tectomicrobia bacterium]